MPAPQPRLMSELAKNQFRSFAIRIPSDWKPNAGALAEMFNNAFATGERSAVPAPMPPALFLAASPNTLHVKTQKEMSRHFGDFIDGICGAICSAWARWQSLAILSGVQVNAVVAAGGVVTGPPLAPLILAEAPKGSQQEQKFSRAIATAISQGWQTYQATLTIPGLPLYPAFAAFPAPFAPPTPNVPVPVAALAQVPLSVSKSALKVAMIAALGDPRALHQLELFDAIAAAFADCFSVWQSTTMVTNLLASGPVPTFAPPAVPTGPVVGGSATMAPGGFA